MAQNPRQRGTRYCTWEDHRVFAATLPLSDPRSRVRDLTDSASASFAQQKQSSTLDIPLTVDSIVLCFDVALYISKFLPANGVCPDPWIKQGDERAVMRLGVPAVTSPAQIALLAVLAPRHPYLHSIRCSFLPGVSSAVMTALAAEGLQEAQVSITLPRTLHCTSLSANIVFCQADLCSPSSPDTVLRLTAALPRLQSLKLLGDSLTKTEVVVDVADLGLAPFVRLTDLSVSSATLDPAVLDLFMACDLHSIAFENVRSADPVAALRATSRSLLHLRLQSTWGSAPQPTLWCDALRHFKALRSLRPMPSDSWCILANLTTLTELDLSFTNVDDDGARAMASLRLEVLNINSTSLSDPSIAVALTPPSIRIVRARNTQFGSLSAVAAAKLHELQCLNLESSEINSDGFEVLSGHMGLEELNLCYTSVDTLATVGTMKRLQRLFVSGCSFTGEQFGHLKTCRCLQVVAANSTKFNEDSMALVAEAPLLQVLEFSDTDVPWDCDSDVYRALSNRGVKLYN